MSVPVKALKQVETEHYVVAFDEENEYFAHEVIVVAEEVWDNLATVYDLLKDYQKIHIYIRDPGDYANGMAIPNKNRVDIYTTALEAGIRGTSHWIRNVVTHELAHIFSIKAASKDNFFGNFTVQSFSYFQNPNWQVQARYEDLVAPIWWIEGVAQYEAYKNGNDFWDSHRDMFLRMAVLEDDLLNYVEMGILDNRNGFYGEMTYNQGFSMMRYIDSVYGEEAVRKIAKAKSYFTFNRSLKKALGVTGDVLYADWKRTLKDRYTAATDPIKGSIREGKKIADGGYRDFHGAYSPDGRWLAYVSNDGYDVTYPHLFVKDLQTGRVKQLTFDRESVESRLQWIDDGGRLLYSRYTDDAALMDIYEYDLKEEKERPLTWHARALDPALSPDGKTIAFVKNDAGIQNLALIGADGRNSRLLTQFNNGTQVYTPCWTPDGKNIIIGIYNGLSRDIAIVNADARPFDRVKKLTDSTFFPDSLNFEDTLGFALLVHTPADERDPALSPDGKTLYYVSNRTGIFNIYRMDLSTWKVEQVSNVVGGAFSPSVHPQGGKVTYTGFHAADYSIYELGLEPSAEISLTFTPRDYGSRFKDPLIFSGSPKNGQYKMGEYRPKFTFWDVGPFLSFEPSYITDTVGFSHLVGGLNFATGELAGYSNLGGRVYAGKDFRSRAGVSYGGDLAYSQGFPSVFGENRVYSPRLEFSGSHRVIRRQSDFKPDPITGSRIPDAAFYSSTDAAADGDIDTLYNLYLDDLKGFFRTAQEYDSYGAFADMTVDGRHRLGTQYYRNFTSFEGDYGDWQRVQRGRVFALDNGRISSKSRDVTARVSGGFADTLKKYDGSTSNVINTTNLLKDFPIFDGHYTTFFYQYSRIVPAFEIPVRADIAAFSAGLVKSRYTLGYQLADSSTLVNLMRDTIETWIDSEGRPISGYQAVHQDDHYFQFEASFLERFPILKNQYHFLTVDAFFGSLDRKLRDDYRVDNYPLFYRSSYFLKAYPYRFDPLDTQTVRDSMPAFAYDDTASSAWIYFNRIQDADTADLLQGNRILYLNAELTINLARSLTFGPLGLLIRGVYLTPFFEAASVWNNDWKNFTLNQLWGRISGSRAGESYIKDAGLRVEVPFLLFENWDAFAYFTWARRLDWDDKILSINSDGQIIGLDADRFWFGIQFVNF